MMEKATKARLRDFAQEPYRIFFPIGTLAAFIGVILWPLHFHGWLSFYPGIAHAHIMAHAFFGAFIVGFLGTAFPRLISARALTGSEVSALVVIHLASLVAYCRGAVRIGDGLFTGMLLAFICMMLPRFLNRKDLPPPGFILVITGVLCGVAGAVLGATQIDPETHPQWLALQKLLSFQGFVLLPILGVAGFLVPRFFGMKGRSEFPQMSAPSAEWKKQALLRAGVAVLILVTFILEASRWIHLGSGLRFAVSFLFCFVELPLFRRSPIKGNSFVWSLRMAFIFLAAGFGAVALYPGYRVALLHTTFIGGFALITMIVATRVVFGHSGHLQSLSRPNRWFLIPVSMITVGFVTRISGDFWPHTMANHYTYGAILWIGGVLFWCVRTMPKVLDIEPE